MDEKNDSTHEVMMKKIHSELECRIVQEGKTVQILSIINQLNACE